MLQLSRSLSEQTHNRLTSIAIPLNTRPTDQIRAKSVAKCIFETYDRDRNKVIDSIEVAPMIIDAYKSFNCVFSPSKTDIDSYLKVLDCNADGKVTLTDL